MLTQTGDAAVKFIATPTVEPVRASRCPVAEPALRWKTGSEGFALLRTSRNRLCDFEATCDRGKLYQLVTVLGPDLKVRVRVKPGFAFGRLLVREREESRALVPGQTHFAAEGLAALGVRVAAVTDIPVRVP